MSLPSLSRKRRAGFSLVEVLLALGVVAAAVLALIGILGATFTSAREIALQHKALNAITQIDGAFQTASGIMGTLPGPATDPAFDRVYRSLKLDGSNFVDFFVYQKTQDKSPAVPVIYLPSTPGKFLLDEAKSPQHDGIDTATVFRMRVRVSHLLDGKFVYLNKDFEPDPSKPANTPVPPGTKPNPLSLPSQPGDYALAYLPLNVEIYPHNFSDETNPGDDPDPLKALVKPIMTQTVVINR